VNEQTDAAHSRQKQKTTHARQQKQTNVTSTLYSVKNGQILVKLKRSAIIVLPMAFGDDGCIGLNTSSQEKCLGRRRRAQHKGKGKGRGKASKPWRDVPSLSDKLPNRTMPMTHTLTLQREKETAPKYKESSEPIQIGKNRPVGNKAMHSSNNKA
jgi:hypothetical protein